MIQNRTAGFFAQPEPEDEDEVDWDNVPTEEDGWAVGW